MARRLHRDGSSQSPRGVSLVDRCVRIRRFLPAPGSRAVPPAAGAQRLRRELRADARGGRPIQRTHARRRGTGSDAHGAPRRAPHRGTDRAADAPGRYDRGQAAAIGVHGRCGRPGGSRPGCRCCHRYRWRDHARRCGRARDRAAHHCPGGADFHDRPRHAQSGRGCGSDERRCHEPGRTHRSATPRDSHDNGGRHDRTDGSDRHTSSDSCAHADGGTDTTAARRRSCRDRRGGARRNPRAGCAHTKACRCGGSACAACNRARPGVAVIGHIHRPPGSDQRRHRR